MVKFHKLNYDLYYPRKKVEIREDYCLLFSIVLVPPPLLVSATPTENDASGDGSLPDDNEQYKRKMICFSLR
jgi:hypothetical protein